MAPNETPVAITSRGLFYFSMYDFMYDFLIFRRFEPFKCQINDFRSFLELTADFVLIGSPGVKALAMPDQRLDGSFRKVSLGADDRDECVPE